MFGLLCAAWSGPLRHGVYFIVKSMEQASPSVPRQPVHPHGADTLLPPFPIIHEFAFAHYLERNDPVLVSW